MILKMIWRADSEDDLEGELKEFCERVDSAWNRAEKSAEYELRRERQERNKRYDEEESRRFQPDDVDESKCCALKWIPKAIKGSQCKNPRAHGSEFCWTHKRKCEWGKVRGVLPGSVLSKYQQKEQRLASLEEKSKQWYSRHLMWHYASQRVPGLKSLTEKKRERAL